MLPKRTSDRCWLTDSDALYAGALDMDESGRPGPRFIRPCRRRDGSRLRDWIEHSPIGSAADALRCGTGYSKKRLQDRLPADIKTAAAHPLNLTDPDRDARQLGGVGVNLNSRATWDRPRPATARRAAGTEAGTDGNARARPSSFKLNGVPFADKVTHFSTRITPASPIAIEFKLLHRNQGIMASPRRLRGRVLGAKTLVDKQILLIATMS